MVSLYFIPAFFECSSFQALLVFDTPNECDADADAAVAVSVTVVRKNARDK